MTDLMTPAEVAEYLRVSRRHFCRHVRPDLTADMPTLQFLAGHRHAITTSRYVHPQAKRAAEALEKRGRDDE